MKTWQIHRKRSFTQKGLKEYSLSPIQPNGQSHVEDHGIDYELTENQGHYEIKSVSAKNEKHQIKIEFSPSFPDMVCLRNHITVNGRFTIGTDQTKGTISGNYRLKKGENKIALHVQPKNGWQPHENRWILKILFLMVKVFKDWPKSYFWSADIQWDDAKQPVMRSSWKRVIIS